MVLSDNEILEALEQGELEVTPPDGFDLLIKPSSIDMRLDPIIHVMRQEMIEQAEIVDPTRMADVVSKIEGCSEKRQLFHDQPFVLEPRSFIIGSTAEKVTLSAGLAARIEGKSSLARFGVPVHLTAPKIDPGFSNKITLEIINLGYFRVYLSPFMEIAALIIERLGRPATQVYTGRFSVK